MDLEEHNMYFEEPNYPFPPCAQVEYDKYMKLAEYYGHKLSVEYTNQWNKYRINKAHMEGLTGLSLGKLSYNRNIQKWLGKLVKCQIRAERIAKLWNERLAGQYEQRR